MSADTVPNPLGALPAKRKTGTELFHTSARPTSVTLAEFWQWSASDLVSNATRGRLAEFIIASALGVASGVRSEWDAFDLLTPAGLKIEVKSAAYLQTWHQLKPSSISFSTRLARVWNTETNSLDPEPRRSADLYIFALLAHQESKETLDPLDLDQWHFYFLTTQQLDARTRSQHSITLKSLQGLCPTPSRYEDLPTAVRSFELDLLGSPER